VGQYFHFILEILATEKCAHTRQRSSSPVLKLASSRSLRLALKSFSMGQYFHFILEILAMEKRTHTRQGWPTINF
jgi:hypothetical protein